MSLSEILNQILNSYRWEFTSFAVPAFFLFIFECLHPAERNQPLRNTFLYLQAQAAYILVVPIVMIFPHWLKNNILEGHCLFNLDLAQMSAGESWLDLLAKLIVFPFIPILIADFFYYWFHRLQHTLPFLWEQHKLHHAAESLNVTASVHHWLEKPLQFLFIGIPYGLLVNISPIKTGLLVMLISHWDLFIHANLRLNFGFLTPVFAGPQYHRIHHSVRPEHLDKNFAAYFPLYDIVFGTYWRPKAKEYPKTGLANGEKVTSIHQYLFLPFLHWNLMLRKSLLRN